MANSVNTARTTVASAGSNSDDHAAHTANLPLGKAINQGLRDALAADSKVLVMGEDVGKLGGVFRVTDGLHAEFGDQRVIDTPLAESGIIGTAIGLAMRGFTPVCEIQFDGFVFPGFNQITTQLAKLHYRSGGKGNFPVVIRLPYGGKIGAIEHHSESPETYFAHTPGLRVVTPSNAADAYCMIREAIACPDPVLFMEPKALYWNKGEVDFAEPEGDGALLNQARVVKPGDNVTLAAYGPSVRVALDSANALAAEGISAEVIDLRSLSPIDYGTIEQSVNKTGRLVVVHEAPTVLGIGSEIAAAVTEKCFYALEAPVLRVGAFHMPYPAAIVEHDYLPTVERVCDAVDTVLGY